MVDASVFVAALDARDARHRESVDFLAEAAARRRPLLAPAIAPVEVACAVARRSGSSRAGADARDALLAHPYLAIVPLDAELLALATDLGCTHRLRAADAIYAATARATSASLVTWDRELVACGAGEEPG